MTDTTPQALFRFVAVRRPAPAEPVLPPPSVEVLLRAFDYTDALLPVAAQAIRERDRETATELARGLLADLPSPLAVAAQRLREVRRRAAVDETLSLGDLRPAPDDGPHREALADVARRATSVVVLNRWLGATGSPATTRATALLRGATVLRLAALPLDDGYRVRDLVRGQTLRLPALPPSARADGPGERIASTPTPTPTPTPNPVPVPLPPPALPVFEARARVLGRGDLMVVRTEHLRYDLGEIAYIENVLRSEVRGRTTVVDTTTGQKVVETTDLSSETSRELTTAERFALQEAASTTNTATTSLSAGVSVSGGFGPVSVGVDVNASNSTSTTQSNSSSSTYGKDVTDRATESMRSQASTRTVTTSRTQVTETNKHDFDNREGTDHVRGVYRWLNKVDRAQVYNYGERLLLEFVVPEPAAQHVHLAGAAASANEPVAPRALDFGPEDVTENTFVTLGRRYDATGLQRPPDKVVTVPATFTFAPSMTTEPVHYDPETAPPAMLANGVTTSQVTIPDGYAAGRVTVSVVYGGQLAVGDKPDPDDVPASTFKQAPVNVAVGGRRISIVAGDAAESHTVELEQQLTGHLPVAIGSQQVNGQAIAVRVIAYRTPEAFKAWQQSTFDLIQQAFLSLQSAYDTAVSVAQVRQGYAASAPPEVNRAVEVRELTRGCQTILTGQDFDQFGALDTPPDEAPRIDLDESWAEADAIAFFSDVFDWSLMTYLFYPYQWAGRHRWAELTARTSTDPLYEAFLQAGAARVVVPVREGFERSAVRYLQTGKVPSWGPKPWRGEPTRYPMVDDLIADANDRPDGEVAVDEPWEVVSPTSLVYLQEDAELNPAVPG
ncbi:hypothetical protein ACIA8B_28620 [Micromonospora chalcea]|uniref:hypothetical protein n=1 Tax=Micromonospora sp. TSRI0369 TaxID=1703936 RepID=UPI0009389990|nr:hypothetical protein [Micromonospora sp. TSRI0369]OKJ46186.1 hypothetical protein AMK25_06635 [Micromonospora sp. TSRI0369]